MLLAAPAMSADAGPGLPAPGTTFTVDRNMAFTNVTASYENIYGQQGAGGSADYTLTLDGSALDARLVSLEYVFLDAVNSTLSSSSTLNINRTTLAGSSISSVMNLALSGPLRAESGSNTLTSSERDIYLGYGTSVADGATLTLTTPGEVAASMGLQATNVHADYLTSFAAATLQNGTFISTNSSGMPTQIAGDLNLLDMATEIGLLYVYGPTRVERGKFEAANANFGASATFIDSRIYFGALNATDLSIQGGALSMNGDDSAPHDIRGAFNLRDADAKIGNITVGGPLTVQGGSFQARMGSFHDLASFTNADVAIDSLTAQDLRADGGSLSLGAENSARSVLSGDVLLRNVKTSLRNIDISGDTLVAGGTFQADDLGLGHATFDNVQAQIDRLSLGGRLSLRNNAALEVNSEGIGANAVHISGSRLNLRGDFSTADLAMESGVLAVQGQVEITKPDFTLDASHILGDAISMQNIASSGQSVLEADGNIEAANINLLSGRLLLQSNSNLGAIRASAIRLHSGASASLQAATSQIGSISGSGSLEAHNLHVGADLLLAGGSLYLSGNNVVERNLGLELTNASVDNLRVKRDAQLDATTLSAKTLVLENGATLARSSYIEAQSLTSHANIQLMDNAEILANELNLGTGHLVLDGSTSQSVIVAVGKFGSGDLTVDTNSLLSIGSDMPDWVHMGMNGHQASAALGLWTPFRLGSGSYAAIGAGSIARNMGTPADNQIYFSPDSLLITSAAVASQDGPGAISATEQSRADIAADAKLHILHAQQDGLYRVLGENLTINYEGNAWEGENVATDSILLRLERLDGDKLGWFQAKAVHPSTVLPGLDPDLGGSIGGTVPPPESDLLPKPPSSNPTVPENPVPPTPDLPNPPIPDQPDTPVQPEPPTPDQPDTPIQPEPPAPDQPDTPIQPNPPVPDQPDSPDTPTPPTPDQPDTPVQPEPPAPDQPDTPGEPNPPAPDEPDQPDTPDTPQEPAGPDNPEEPGSPDDPETPDEPATAPAGYIYTPGQLFLSRATNFWVIGHDPRLAARTIESAARIYAAGAVPEMTVAANQAGAAAMSQRTGAQSGGGIQVTDADGQPIQDGKNWHGMALWISPLYKSINGYSLTSGNFDVDVNGALGGVALGIDYTFETALRLGLSFNIGGGYAQGGGQLADTSNSMSFWGLGAYGGWHSGNFDLGVDVAFTSTYNRLEQELPAAMLMEDLKSDITAWALSAGIELGYAIPTRFVNMRPHAGARYTYLHNDAYDVNSGGAVLEGRAKGQNIWTFPAGITFDRNFCLENGWQVRPLLDLSVIPAAGDVKTRSEVRFTGTPSWTTLKDQFMDNISYRGTVGLEFGSDNITVGVNYSVQAGMKTSSQAITGTFAYSF